MKNSELFIIRDKIPSCPSWLRVKRKEIKAVSHQATKNTKTHKEKPSSCPFECFVSSCEKKKNKSIFAQSHQEHKGSQRRKLVFRRK